MYSKRKVNLICLLLCALLILGGAPGVYGDTAYDTEALIDGILSYVISDSGASSLDDWCQTALADGAGSSSEWYAIALSRYKGSLDFTAYGDALEKFLQEGVTASVVTKEKYILALLSIQRAGSLSLIEGLSDAVGAQGLMSWVYGLHLLTNGVILENHTVEEAVSTLLSSQLEDGGWAIMGTYGDVDVTAMTLQALAPYCSQSDVVKNACDTALAFLSSKQLSTGDFPGFNGPNPESTAQVLMALCALDINVYTDERFIKEGATVLDGLLLYHLEDGSFCHELNQGTDGNATVQALCALVSLWRWEQGASPLYQFVDTVPTLGALSLSTVIPEDTAAPVPVASPVARPDEKDSNDENAQTSYKPYAIGGVCLVCGLWCLVLVLKKKKQPRQYLFVLLVGLVLVAVILLTDISSAEEYYASPPSKENATGKVTMTIRCDTVAGQAEHIPSDGVVLPETVFDIQEGDTVYTILTEAAQTYGIQIDNQGSERLVYIAGIGYLYEFDFGQYSGWVYHVNGDTPGVGAGEYVLEDGDVIRWLYTCNLGQDVEE